VNTKAPQLQTLIPNLQLQQKLMILRTTEPIISQKLLIEPFKALPQT
jgi:hypothetical protein